MKNLPRDIQTLANYQGWEEDEMLGHLADFITQNNLEDDLLEFLQEEVEKSGDSGIEEPDEDADNDD